MRSYRVIPCDSFKMFVEKSTTSLCEIPLYPVRISLRCTSHINNLMSIRRPLDMHDFVLGKTGHKTGHKILAKQITHLIDLLEDISYSKLLCKFEDK